MSSIKIHQQQSLSGYDLVLFRIKNAKDCYVDILNWGATLVSIVVPDKHNTRENVILNYNNIADYLSDAAYLGCTVGRFANRISNAQFTLNGKNYLLDKNDGENSNHGGFTGFNKKIYQHSIEGDTLVLTTKSKDGEGGFPGNMRFSVRYSFDDENILHIEYRAVSDQDTLFNPTNHAYFDLSAGKSNPLDQELKVEADTFLEMNDKFLPTGKILNMEGTPFDFRSYTSFAKQMPFKNEILKGYNTYFIGREKAATSSVLRAALCDNYSGRILQVYSDMPGIQCYTGDYLSGEHSAFSGVCLEAQAYPDAPTYTHFPSCILLKDKEFISHIDYCFA